MFKFITYPLFYPIYPCPGKQSRLHVRRAGNLRLQEQVAAGREEPYRSTEPAALCREYHPPHGCSTTYLNSYRKFWLDLVMSE